MSATDITVSIDSELKERAQSVFDALGIDISTAINMILCKAIGQGEVSPSFEYDDSIYLLKPDLTKTPTLGRLEGLIEIPDDFDEPLEEMKEYMY